jgi:hypothetical protein
MVHYEIRRVSPGSAFKFGCVVGGVIMLPIGLVGGFVGLMVIGALRAWLESWQHLNLALIELDLLQVLELAELLTWLQSLDNLGLLTVAGLILALGAAGGFVIGALAALGAIVYNLVAALTGGLGVTLERQ